MVEMSQKEVEEFEVVEKEEQASIQDVEEFEVVEMQKPLEEISKDHDQNLKATEGDHI